jgi:regulation of enolase protein 1 (concanavalin A-like superfamily)
VVPWRSDWATQPWPTFELRLRLYKQGSSFVLEHYQPEDDTWNFTRIFYLTGSDSPSARETRRFGPMACAPSGR